MLPIAYVGLVKAQQSIRPLTHEPPRLPPPPRAILLCAQVIKYNQVVIYHDLAATSLTPLDACAIQGGVAHTILFCVGAPVRMASQHAMPGWHAAL